MSRCVIFGSAPTDQIERLKPLLQNDDFVICADGGTRLAHRLGLQPHLMIGDFDSYQEALPDQVEVIRLPVNKDDTDLMYSIKEGLRRGYRSFLLLGALGGRLDHTYGNLCALEYLARNGAANLLADGKNQALIQTEGEILLTEKVGKTVSVFPFGVGECVVSYEGMAYPLSYGTLCSKEPVGVSNQILSPLAKIQIHKGPVLIILSED